MDLQLVRDTAQPSYTYGTLTAGALILQTLELGWAPEPGELCGRPDRSCVPAGVYQLVLHDSPKHPRTFALVNPDLGIYHEPGDAPQGIFCRFATLIHVANFPTELEGCIGVGKTRSNADQPAAVWLSGQAMREFQAAVPWEGGHTITISYAAGVSPP